MSGFTPFDVAFKRFIHNLTVCVIDEYRKFDSWYGANFFAFIGSIANFFQM